VTPDRSVSFDRQRVAVLLEKLERLASGDTQESLEISPAHDELDAIAHGINVLADELRWAHARITEELAHLGRVTMLDALTGSLAHEINQPLTAVMANTEAALRLMASQPPRIGDLHETLNEILSDNKRAADVVRRMRTLLRKGARQHEPIEMNGSVVEVLKLIQNNAASRQISLDVDLASGLEPVLGDRVQIQQVVLNLLLNAFDAVQECQGDDRQVRLRTSAQDSAAVVEVSDYGSGLPDEALALIFEPFFTTKRDGMGLGLWICRAIVGAHGGTLAAARNPGAGLTFSARFPVWKAFEPDLSRSSVDARLRERP
jgi:two-component system sensor kinase FixL